MIYNKERGCLHCRPSSFLLGNN